MKSQSNSSSSEIRKTIENNWQEYLSKYGNLFRSDSISGSSPPSIFVGSYGYPKVASRWAARIARISEKITNANTRSH